MLAKKYDNGENILSAMPVANPHIPENILDAFPARDISGSPNETIRQIVETRRAPVIKSPPVFALLSI
ncbi:MAG: hypothetical protein LBI02_01875 [Opitutaceae bacterium]|nr:hypothetical protein [Opitutaceae bacterium]